MTSHDYAGMWPDGPCKVCGDVRILHDRPVRPRHIDYESDKAYREEFGTSERNYRWAEEETR